VRGRNIVAHVQQAQVQEVRQLTDVRAYLNSVTLEALLTQLKANGSTQKAFAEHIGMNTRHLSAMKSSELPITISMSWTQ